MLIDCDYCEKEFYKRPSHIKKSKTHCCSKECTDRLKGSISYICQNCGIVGKTGQNTKKKYCSRKCADKAKITKIEVECGGCGKKFFRSSSAKKKNKTGLYFCGNQCKTKYYRRINVVKCVICKIDFYKNSSDRERYPVHCCSVKCRNEHNNKRVRIECGNCEKVFYRPPSLIKGKKNIFCSKDCHDMFQDNKVEFKCDKCGKKYKTSKANYKRTRNHFCSPACFSKFKFEFSFVEVQFAKMVDKLGVQYERNDRTVVGPLELDFYFPTINYAVEINGNFHYKPIKGDDALKKQKKRDTRKRKKCKELGITLRTVKPGNCKYETFIPRYKRVIWEIKKLISENK